MARKKSLVERFGKLPAGMSKADAEAVLQFLYGAFDKRTAKQVRILHPYLGDSNSDGDSNEFPSELTVLEFCQWLRSVAA